MKIGVIVYSHTGNTFSIGERIKAEWEQQGHEVRLERVISTSEKPEEAGKAPLKESPDTSSYDKIIFGAPVWAFSLSGVMKIYLTQLASLQGKKVCCFVTQSFPFSWMGGNRAVKTMKRLCEEKGAEVMELGVIHWGRKDRENNVKAMIRRFS
jgi:flavodoxin